MIYNKEKEIKREIKFQIDELKEGFLLNKEKAIGDYQFINDGMRRCKKINGLLLLLKNKF